MAAKDGVQGRRRLRIFAAATALVLLCAVCVGGVNGATWSSGGVTKWAVGLGTASDPYEISSAEELALLAENVNAGNSYSGTYFELTADIDLGGKTWTPIGTTTNYKNGQAFSGIFDGQKHTISNINSVLTKSDKVGGLFGYVSGGTVRNVIIDSASVSGDTGGLKGLSCTVAVLQDGYIQNCSIVGDVSSIVDLKSSETPIGGIAGTVVDSNGHTVSASVVIDRITGCTMVNVTTIENKNIVAAPLVGAPNMIDDGGGNDEPPVQLSALYYTYIYQMDTSGNYRRINNISSSGIVGSEVSADYDIPSGFSLDDDMSYLFGEVKSDGSLILNVYIKRNQTTITFMSDGKIHGTVNGYYDSDVVIVEDPIKPGYKFVRWEPSVPDKFPAEGMTVDAVWEEIPVFFEIVIPEDLELSNKTYNGTMSVVATKLSIPVNSKIVITVNSEHEFKLVEPTGESLSYDLTVVGGEPLKQNDEIVVFRMDSDVRQEDLYAELTETPRYAGLYQDSLTFTVIFEEV